jgi:hypothetical protein
MTLAEEEEEKVVVVAVVAGSLGRGLLRISHLHDGFFILHIELHIENFMIHHVEFPPGT